ncbi:MAG: M16 family metallopeptidase [Alkalispirochaetaceae bacterium]
MRSKLLSAATAALFFALILTPTTLPATGVREYPAAEGEALELNPEVRTGVLDNGFTYYILENPRPDNLASFRLAVNAGSLMEEEDQLGLAHFLEHMAFNGTASFEGNELVRYMESLGMRFGPDVNAYTSFGETVYRLEVPTDNTEQFETGMQIMREWATDITFAEDEIERERGVVIEEWRTGQGPTSRIQNQHLQVIFADSRYAERLPIGDVEVLRTFQRRELVSFYETWYRPDLMSFIAVGDFDGEEVEQMVRSTFSSLTLPTTPRIRPVYPIPDHPGTRVSIASDPEASSNSVVVYNKMAPFRLFTLDDYRELLTYTLYSIMFNNRLEEIARAPEAPFLRAGAGRSNLVRAKGVTVVSAQAETGALPTALEAILLESKRAEEHGFAQSELDRAKDQLLASMRQLYNNRNAIESTRRADELIRYHLEDEAAPGIEGEWELYQQFIPEISLSEVNRFAADALQEENRVVTLSAVESDSDPAPTEAQVREILASIASREVAPYEDRVINRPLIEEPPEPGSITDEEFHEEVETRELRLSNGARVLIKQTDFKDDEIIFRAWSPGGTSLLDDLTARNARHATMVASESGLGSFSRDDLQRLLSGVSVSLEPYIGGTDEGFTGSSSVEDFETLLQLLHLSFTEPRLDEQAATSYLRRLRQEISTQANDPRGQFQLTLQEIYAQGDRRQAPLTPDNIDEITLERMREAYSDRFEGAGDFTFTFVGNISPEQARPLLERYIASLPEGAVGEEPRDRGFRPPMERVEETVRAGREPVSQVAILYSGEYDWSREENYRFSSMIDAVRILLRQQIREEAGGTYGVGIGGLQQLEPYEVYLIQIGFGTDPERVEELTEELYDTLESAKEGALDESFVERVTATQREEFERSLIENGFWASALETAVEYDRQFSSILTYPELIDSLTTEDLTAAAEAYLERSRSVELTLLPAAD